jgi:hypothetical protein
MYYLPRLRHMAPEFYAPLRCMPVLDLATWWDALVGEFVYACQDATFGVGMGAVQPAGDAGGMPRVCRAPDDDACRTLERA